MKKAFTLLEIIVVICIIAVMSGVSLGVIKYIRLEQVKSSEIKRLELDSFIAVDFLTHNLSNSIPKLTRYKKDYDSDCFAVDSCKRANLPLIEIDIGGTKLSLNGNNFEIYEVMEWVNIYKNVFFDINCFNVEKAKNNTIELASLTCNADMYYTSKYGLVFSSAFESNSDTAIEDNLNNIEKGIVTSDNNNALNLSSRAYLADKIIQLKFDKTDSSLKYRIKNINDSVYSENILIKDVDTFNIRLNSSGYSVELCLRSKIDDKIKICKQGIAL